MTIHSKLKSIERDRYQVVGAGPLPPMSKIKLDKLHSHVIKSTFHSIVHRDIQEECGSSRILTALVLKFAGAQLLY